MGRYFDTIFGGKTTVFFTGIIAFFATMYSDFIGEMGYTIVQLVIAVFGLYIVDTILGSMVALRHSEFNSRSFARAIDKLVVYSLSVVGMTAFGTLVGILPAVSGIPIVEYDVSTISRLFFIWTMLLIGLTEFISTVENLRILGFKLPKNVDNLIKWMSDKLCQINLVNGKDDEDVCGGEEGGVDSTGKKG